MSRFRYLVAGTLAATYLLMLIGAYTSAIGAGLACPGWPKCFPEAEGLSAWVPDLSNRLVFAEWFHRLVASLTGFLIIGTALAAWRTGQDRRVVFWTAAAAVILPLQVVLGGITVLGQMDTPTSRGPLVTAHLAVGTAIFGALLIATYVSWRDAGRRPEAAREASAEAAPAAHGSAPVTAPVDVGGDRASVSDWVEVTKPGILFLLVVVGLVTMFVAAGGPYVTPRLIVGTVVGGGLAAASASVLNNFLDRDVDQRMYRTRTRAIASSRIRPAQAVAYATVLGAASMAILWVLVNPLAAALAMGGLLFYVVIYTLGLKRHTPQNIVIGGAAGGFPALVGWAAVTNEVSLAAVLLGAIVFLWTPPHFWALALVYKNDYARADIPMLPVTKGVDETKRQILIYTALLVAVTLVFYYPLNVLGLPYLAMASALGGVFLYLAWKLWREYSAKVSYRLFWYSIVYLGALYVAMGVDRLLV